jgi:hypothetical protein
MKKIALILFLAVMSLTSQAQLLLIKTTGYSWQTGENYVFSEWSEWAQPEAPLHIYCDFEKNTMRIDNKSEDFFHISASYEKGTAEENDFKYGYSRYIAKDKNGTTCYITIRSWEVGNATQIYIKYANLHYVYQGSVVMFPVDTSGPKIEI